MVPGILGVLYSGCDGGELVFELILGFTLILRLNVLKSCLPPG